MAAWLGRRVGDLAFLALAGRRRAALANIATAFPRATPTHRRRICRGSFQHLGLMFVELCAAVIEPPERTLEGITLDGLGHLTHAMDTYGRALILTAHLGNWELLAIAQRLMGVPATVVVRPLDAPWLDAVADRLRRRAGVEVVDKRGALRPVLGALRRRRMVALLLDQNASRREGVFVTFFGRPASTSKSLAVLAVRTRAPVVPIFIYRETMRRHRVVIHPPLPLDRGGDSDAAIVALTQRCTTAIEGAIEVAPEQWLWVHDRWRTRPGPPSGPGP